MRTARALIGEGFIKKAVDTLTSYGTGDMSKEVVINQLKGKHPPRKGEVVEPDFTGIAEFEPDLEGVLRKLPRKSGIGPDGWANEHLIVLDNPVGFKRPEAAGIIGSMNAFAKLYANGGLPAWYYKAISAVRLVALKKEEAVDSDDVRPIGVGNVLRRAIARTIVRSLRSKTEEYLAPVQLGCAVRDGAIKLAFHIREVMEQHKDFVLIKVDKKNAFNEGVVLDVIAKNGLW